MAQTVKNLPAMQETWIHSLGGEDPLEKGMATHSSIGAQEIPQRNLGGLQSMGSQKSWTQLSNSTNQIHHILPHSLCFQDAF